MPSVPSHRLSPPVSLPRCHRHFSASSTCFACMDGLKVRYYLGGPACLLVCSLARSPTASRSSCISCAQRNCTLPPATWKTLQTPPAFAHHGTDTQAKSKGSTSVHAANTTASSRRGCSSRTQHVGSRQHDAENCNRPALNEPDAAIARRYPVRHGGILPPRRSRRAILRSLRPHLSLPQAVRRSLVGGMVASVAAQDAEQR